MIKNYLEYLKNVLGVQTIQLPANELSLFVENDKPWTTKQVKPYRLIVLNCLTKSEQSLREPAVEELFMKMIAAMKLGEMPVAFLDVMSLNRELIQTELSQLVTVDFILCMSAEPQHRGQFQIKGTVNWLETYSADYLLKTPKAKKIVWDDLQLLMNQLNL